MIGVGEVIAFFIGGVVGRYLEEIVSGVNRIRKDLAKAQSELNKLGGKRKK